MKKPLIFLFSLGLLLAVFGCKPARFHRPVAYELRYEALRIIDSFLLLHPSTYVELHVNKVCGAPFCIAVLYGGESPLSSVAAGAYAYASDGTCVGVYSGLEDLCVSSVTLPPVDTALVKQGTFWLIKRGIDGWSVQEGDNRMFSPFIPVPGLIPAHELNTRHMMDSVNKRDEGPVRGIRY